MRGFSAAIKFYASRWECHEICGNDLCSRYLYVQQLILAFLACKGRTHLFSIMHIPPDHSDIQLQRCPNLVIKSDTPKGTFCSFKHVIL